MSEILPILTARSYEHIYYVTNILWNENYPNFTIVQHVNNSLGESSYKEALTTYLKVITLLPAQSFANAIYTAITNKKRETLTYYLISRSELDTLDIKTSFRNCYNVTLDEFIKKKLGKGDYEKLMRMVLTVEAGYDPRAYNSNSSLVQK